MILESGFAGGHIYGIETLDDAKHITGAYEPERSVVVKD